MPPSATGDGVGETRLEFQHRKAGACDVAARALARSRRDRELFETVEKDLDGLVVDRPAFDSEHDNQVTGRSETGGFVITRQGTVVTSIEGLPDDTLKAIAERLKPAGETNTEPL